MCGESMAFMSSHGSKIIYLCIYASDISAADIVPFIRRSKNINVCVCVCVTVQRLVLSFFLRVLYVLYTHLVYTSRVRSACAWSGEGRGISDAPPVARLLLTPPPVPFGGRPREREETR